MKTTTTPTATIEMFDTLAELVRYLETTHTNDHYRGRCYANNSDSGWATKSRTRSVEEAFDLLLNGWTEPLARIKRSMAGLKATARDTRTETRYNVVGHTPSVPRAIMGIPDSMVETRRVPMPRKTIALAFDIGASHDVKPETLIDGGVTVLGAVNSLEAQGYKVRLMLGNIVTFSTGHRQVGSAGFMVVMKDYRHPLDLKKLCFPLAHPSMLRRVALRHTEVSAATPTYDSGYGYPMSVMRGKATALRAELARENTYYYITTADTEKANGDPVALLKSLGIAE